MDAAERIEQVRRAAERFGVPMAAAEALTLPLPRAARLLGVSTERLRELLAESETPVVQFGPRLTMIDVVDLLALIDAHKRLLAPARPVVSQATLDALARMFPAARRRA